MLQWEERSEHLASKLQDIETPQESRVLATKPLFSQLKRAARGKNCSTFRNVTGEAQPQSPWQLVLAVLDVLAQRAPAHVLGDQIEPTVLCVGVCVSVGGWVWVWVGEWVCVWTRGRGECCA